jgi:hypothetical protein
MKILKSFRIDPNIDAGLVSFSKIAGLSEGRVVEQALSTFFSLRSELNGRN